MAEIIPLVPLKAPEPEAPKQESFISVAFCKGFEFDPNKTDTPEFIEASKEALGEKVVKGAPCNVIPVTIAPAYAVFNDQDQIIGIVFSQEAFAPMQSPRR